MFNLQFSEVLIILAVALVFLGPRKLPELARSVGKALRELRRAGDELKGVMDDDVTRPAAPPRRPVDTLPVYDEQRTVDEAWPPEAGPKAEAPSPKAAPEAAAAPETEAVPDAEEPGRGG